MADEKFPPNNYTDPVSNKETALEATELKEKRQVHAKIKKKTFGEKIADNFMSIDKEQVRDRLLFDWLFPEIISTIDDFLRMVFFGRTDRRSSGPSQRSGYTNYRGISDDRRREQSRYSSVSSPESNFRRIRIPFYSREDALYVMDEIRESLEESAGGYVTVKELYSLADMPTNYAMNSWGWYDLEDITIVRQGEDYVLEMPKAEVIRR